MAEIYEEQDLYSGQETYHDELGAMAWDHAERGVQIGDEDFLEAYNIHGEPYLEAYRDQGARYAAEQEVRGYGLHDEQRYDEGAEAFANANAILFPVSEVDAIVGGEAIMSALEKHDIIDNGYVATRQAGARVRPYEGMKNIDGDDRSSNEILSDMGWKYIGDDFGIEGEALIPDPADRRRYQTGMKWFFAYDSALRESADNTDDASFTDDTVQEMLDAKQLLEDESWSAVEATLDDDSHLGRMLTYAREAEKSKYRHLLEDKQQEEARGNNYALSVLTHNLHGREHPDDEEDRMKEYQENLGRRTDAHKTVLTNRINELPIRPGNPWRVA